VIRFEAVTQRYPAADGRERTVLRDLDLEVRRGESLCVIGASGCGKTTLLKLVNRMLAPSAGRVRVAGEDVAGLDPVALRRRIGTVVQSGALFPHMTVAENVGLLPHLVGHDKARVAERVRTLLTLVHLEPDEFAERYPRALSGGQRQRVGVARALALDPEILLLDEPFGALDPITRAELQTEFLELEGRSARTVLFVTHDLDEAFRMGDRVVLLSEGRVAQVGTPEEFRDAPASEHVRDFVRRHFHGA